MATGYLPLRVSAPSKIPSHPSKTAFATSVASALYHPQHELQGLSQ